MASSLIGSLRVALSLGTADFEAGAAKASQVARTRAKEMETAFGGAKAAVTGFFAAFTVGALTEVVKKSLEYAGSIAEVARTLGVTTTQLQEYRYAAGQTGVAQEQLETGLRKLTQSMGQAEAGSQKQIKAFNAIGISLDQLKGKNTGDIFKVVADGLEKIPDRAQRAAVEVALFGRSGAMLDNLLSGGSARINELSEAAKTLGIVLSDEQIQGAEETAHKLEAVKTVLEAQIAGVVANNANAILSLSSALATLTGEIVRFLGSNPQLALGIVGALLGGRVGGLPGAVLGGAAGAVLGGNLQNIANDSNMDVNFRAQQLRAAKQAYLDSTKPRAPATVGGHLGGSGGSFVPDTAVAKKEMDRQTALLWQAIKASKQPAQQNPPASSIPQFLAGNAPKPKKPKQAPIDRSDDVAYGFAQEQTRADMELLQAKMQLTHDVSEQAALQLQMLDLEKQARDAEIDHRVAKAKEDFAQGRITQATLDEVVKQAAILKAKGDQADKLKAQAILDDRDQQLRQEQLQIDAHWLEIKQTMLQKQADLATTQSERRKIELELLQIAYDEKRRALQDTIEHSKDAVAIENARRDLQTLPANQALDAAAIHKQTEGPLEQYLQGIPHTVAQTQEALQSLEVQGLDGLATALSKVGEGWKAMRDVALQTIQDILSALIKMQIEKMFFSILGGAAGGPSGGIPSIGSGDIPAWGSPGSPSGVPGFALGGSFNIRGRAGTDRNLLSLNGVPIAKVSRDERLTIGNDNQRGGGAPAFVFNNYARMSPDEARTTGAQAAAGWNREMERQRRKGTA